MALSNREATILRAIYGAEQADPPMTVRAHLHRGGDDEWYSLEAVRAHEPAGREVYGEHNTGVVASLSDKGYIGMRAVGRGVYELRLTPKGREVIQRQISSPSRAGTGWPPSSDRR